LPSAPVAAQVERQRRFEAAYAAHRGPVLGYVLRRTASPDDAADVLAETFLTAWRRLEDMPREPQSRLWLYGVARRVLANHYRGERRRSALADRLRADLVAAYHPPEYTGELARIAAAFRALPAAERELLGRARPGPDRRRPGLLAERRPDPAAPSAQALRGSAG
jgi:DNA-directed RNA polymerase specialized sigma24 family protein